MSDQSRAIAAAIKNFFDSDELRYDFDEENELFVLKFDSDCKFQTLQLLIVAHDDHFFIRCVPPLNAEKENYKELAYFLNYINSEYKKGFFSLDIEDGEIAYKYLVDCDLGIPNADIIGAAIGQSLRMYDDYGNEIFKVAFGIMSGDAAIEKIKEKED